MMTHLVADHRANPAVIDRWVGIGIEERRLEDRRGEGNRDDLEVGLRIDGHRVEAPLPAHDRLTELVDVPVVRPLVGTNRIAEQIIAATSKV